MTTYAKAVFQALVATKAVSEAQADGLVHKYEEGITESARPTRSPEQCADLILRGENITVVEPLDRQLAASPQAQANEKSWEKALPTAEEMRQPDGTETDDDESTADQA